MKRLVLFVEGEGESDAVPRLVSRLLTELKAWDILYLDNAPFRVGQIQKLVKGQFREWKRKLAACLKRKDVGAVLVLLDGDLERIGGISFCSATIARELANEAMQLGGAAIFSVAIVFARQEFETWFIAGIESVAGQQLPDGRLVQPAAKAPDGDLEKRPRDAKGWLSQVIEGGYKPTRDQAALSDMADLQTVRARKLRSFQRLEAAISELVSAIRSEKHVVTPR